jgi:hypothetical protein
MAANPTLTAGSAWVQVPTSQKVIKDPAEYNAYINALNITDPAGKGQAMEAFIAQYPGSIVKTDAMEQAMGAYQQAQNSQKVEQIAGQILAIEPNNVRALAKRSLQCQDIVDLLGSRVREGYLIDQIHAHGCSCDLTADNAAKLRASGASDELMTTIIQPK